MSTIKQISVFAQNQPGRIERIAEILAHTDINIRAITIASGEDYGIIKLLVDKPRQAADTLRDEGLSVALNDVLAAEMTDNPGGLSLLLQALAEHEINIEDAYGFVIDSGHRAVLVVRVQNALRAAKILADGNVKLLREQELYEL